MFLDQVVNHAKWSCPCSCLSHALTCLWDTYLVVWNIRFGCIALIPFNFQRPKRQKRIDIKNSRSIAGMTYGLRHSTNVVAKTGCPEHKKCLVVCTLKCISYICTKYIIHVDIWVYAWSVQIRVQQLHVARPPVFIVRTCVETNFWARKPTWLHPKTQLSF